MMLNIASLPNAAGCRSERSNRKTSASASAVAVVRVISVG